MSCTYCMAGFKKPRKALLESLVIPGWGDLYLGHKLLGSAELVGSLLIWRMAVSNLLAGETTAAGMLVLILIFYNGVDGLVTYHMAKKGYMIAQ